MKDIRLDSLLSQRGYCARRKVQDFLQAHVVLLGQNQRLTLPGTRISEGAELFIDGVKIRPNVPHYYIALYKPEGYVSSVHDPFHRPVALDLIPQAKQARLYNVGRLDMDSCGLLLFTNDGTWAKHVMHPRYEIEKEYEVYLNKPVTQDMLNSMQKGLYLQQEWLCIDRYTRMPQPTQVKLVLKQGRNREIRRLFAHFQLHVVKLKRLRIGHITLGDMRPGESRELSSQEVDYLTLI